VWLMASSTTALGTFSPKKTTVGFTTPTWQAVHEGTQNWEWSWKSTFASPSGRMPASAETEDEAKKAAETDGMLLGGTGAVVPTTMGEDAAACASGSQSGLAASRRAWK